MLKTTATIAALALLATSGAAFAAGAHEPQENGGQPGPQTSQPLPPPAKPKVLPQGNLFPAIGGILAAGLGGAAAATQSTSP